MPYRCRLPCADQFAGLVTLNASLPDTKELESNLPDDRTQPIFISHGLSDPLISAETAVTAWQFLDKAGYNPEYQEYNMSHEINTAILNDLAPWITRVLPPLE